MAIKFSQFNLRTDSTATMYLVGYDGNQNIHITVDNLFNDLIDGTENTIAMFGPGGNKVIDSMLSQNADATILTIGGQLNVDAAATFDTSITVTGNSTLNGNVTLGDASADLITQTGTLYLNGPIKDTTDTLGEADQILVSDAGGLLNFQDLSATHVESAEVVKVPVKNLQGSGLTKGDPVYISGSVGESGKLEVKLADASNSAKMPAVGLLFQDLGINGEGYVVITGKLRNLTTDPIDGQTPLANDVIYVKPGGVTGDALTLTKPVGSNLIQNMGKVGRVSSANSGNFVVSSILRTNDIPNLTPGKIWVGSTGNTIESAFINVDEANTTLTITGNTTTTGDVQIDTLSNNFIPVNNSQGVLRDSVIYQVSLAGSDPRNKAVTLNTFQSDSVYGERPDLRVASRSLNDPGVLDLFRPDGDVQAGDRVGILQYSLHDDNQYAVAQIEVKTIANSGSGNSGGGKLCIKTSTNLSGAAPTERLCINNTEADFLVPVNVTSTAQSSFAGQVTIPITPIAGTDAASKAYVDLQNTGQVTGTGTTLTVPMWLGTTPTNNLANSPITFREVSPGATNPYSLQFGGFSQATGLRNSIAMGYNNQAQGEATLATGHQTTANGLHAASFNFQTTASGEKSAAFGDNTVASGKSSFAIGNNTTAATSLSFAGGKNSTANPDTNFETAFAYGNNVSSTGNNSAAFGLNTIASGERSFVAGTSSTASGINAVALGGQNEATGDLSFAAGFDSTASGHFSVAIGNQNTSSQIGSVTIGQGLTTDRVDQVVVGRYNASGSSASFVVGVGGDVVRKNGLEINAQNVNLPQYGTGSVTGTAAYNLSVDSTGKIIETAIPTAPSYTSFVCLLSQSGGANPLPDMVLENSLGIPTPYQAFTRVSAGIYNLNAPGKFLPLKTIMLAASGSGPSGTSGNVGFSFVDVDNLRILTSGADNFTKIGIEIRTYN